MAGVSQSASAQAGVALVIGAPERRRSAVSAVRALGVGAVEFDDPYAAMAALCRQLDDVTVIVLSLHGVYREELQVIPAVKRVRADVEVWLSDIDGRSAALAEGMRLGADALLGEDGLHRLGGSEGSARQPPRGSASAAAPATKPRHTDSVSAPVARVQPGGPGHPAGRGDDDGHRDSRDGEPTDSRYNGLSLQHGEAPPNGASPVSSASSLEREDDYNLAPGEPILSAEELRALLHDHPDPSPLARDDV